MIRSVNGQTGFLYWFMRSMPLLFAYVGSREISNGKASASLQCIFHLFSGFINIVTITASSFIFSQNQSLILSFMCRKHPQPCTCIVSMHVIDYQIYECAILLNASPWHCWLLHSIRA